MKVLFLDIDGVLNTDSHYVSLVMQNENCGTKNIVRDGFGHVFSPDAVRWLDILVKRHDLKLVIISDWRYNGLEWMRELWRHRNLPGEIYGITDNLLYVPDEDGFPTRSEKYRGHEVEDFLDRHPEIDRWAVIDDNWQFLNKQTEHVVIVDGAHGLDYESYRELDRILSEPELKKVGKTKKKK